MPRPKPPIRPLSQIAQGLIFNKFKAEKKDPSLVQIAYVRLPRYLYNRVKRLAFLEQRPVSQMITFLLVMSMHSLSAEKMRGRLRAFEKFIERENERAMEHYDKTGRKIDPGESRRPVQ